MTSRQVSLVMLLLAVGLTAQLSCPAQPVGRKSPVIIAFTTGGIHGSDMINVYSETSGLRCIVKSAGLFNTGLYGYDALSDTWVLGVPFDSNYGPGRLVTIHRGKRNIIRLPQFPEDDSTQETALTGGMITVAYLDDYRLVLNSYNLKGSLKTKRILRISNGTALEEVISVAVARNGLVAADLAARNVAGSGLYIFDKKGTLVERISTGGFPEFDAEGRRLAYQDYSVTCSAKTGKQGTSHEQMGNIIIYDLKTKTKRAIAVGSPPDAAQYTMTGGIAFHTFHWSTDGRCLVCSYTQGEFAEQLIYIIDITSEKPKWKKLPIEPIAWTVVSKMPK